MAQIPPSFIDFILSRDLADGVMLAGCAGGDCQYRLGQLWTEQRLGRERDPRLRKRVDNHRIALLWQLPWSSQGKPGRALQAFRERLTGQETAANRETEAGAASTPKWRELAIAVLAHGPFYALVGIVSVWPRLSLLEPGEAMVSLTFSHAGQRIGECRTFSQEELMKLPPNMRKPSDCPRERHPVRVEFQVDGQIAVEDIKAPSGLWSDGKSTFYHRVPVSAGDHRMFIGMADSNRPAGFDYELEVDLSLEPEQHVVVEFDSEHNAFLMR